MIIKVISSFLFKGVKYIHQSEESMNKEGRFLKQDILMLTFHINLRSKEIVSSSYLFAIKYYLQSNRDKKMIIVIILF